jgi:hypothetical protein
MAKEILLISEHPEDPAFVSEVAQTIQAQVKTAPDAKQAMDLIAGGSFSAIFLDVSKLDRLKAFEQEVQKRFGLLGEQIQPNRMHFISDVPLNAKRDVIRSPFFGSFFQRPAMAAEQAGKFYGRTISASENAGDQSIERFFAKAGEVQTMILDQSGQKQEAAEAVRQYLIEAKIPARIANTLANVLDELLMNALFDAPADEFGRQLYTLTSRDENRKLTEREVVKTKIGFDGYYVGFSIKDQFGTLDRTRLLNHVSLNYRERDYNLRQGGAGAGLGLATILHTGGSLSYHCEEGRKTQAQLLTRVEDNYRDFKSQFRFFSANFYGA